MKILKKNGNVLFKQTERISKGIIYCLIVCSLIFSSCASSSSKCDDLIGAWDEDGGGEQGFEVNISKNGDQYVLSLRHSVVDGSYPATCDNGKLKVNLPLLGTVELSKDAFYILGKKMHRSTKS